MGSTVEEGAAVGSGGAVSVGFGNSVGALVGVAPPHAVRSMARPRDPIHIDINLKSSLALVLIVLSPDFNIVAGGLWQTVSVETMPEEIKQTGDCHRNPHFCPFLDVARPNPDQRTEWHYQQEERDNAPALLHTQIAN